ncbi:SDR family oxidoreductase [Gordonia terrae]|uniref:NmrA family protein n=2 Tax=Gordonia terrae TaxID=2055 RepID=A0AAD0KGS2_9ACTN|nr:SDR family oxidoreductase [Gordonia terrae]VTR08514.1 Uncharacterised protein [Clostridioides difficile]ANY25563.1 NmrA family protein [Gordonia terrae]AWO86306.1 NmrA family protein [Gordonia terrae]VTS63905.1 Uncharacterised protein [Gordonia terrae]GAB44253.1 hypothetical protein GOTRE_060_01620 [Gordonia terrae NBRC 100016]
MRIFIAGGRGRVGGPLAEVLQQRGVDVVLGGRDDGVDAVTGHGLAEALVGVDTIVNVLNTNQFDAEAAIDFFETTTHNLTAAGESAGVGRHVVLSIVGVGAGDASANGYYAGKVAQERALREGSIRSTIVRATQFHGYIPVLAEQFVHDGKVVGSPSLIQPVELSEVVALLAEVATSPEVDDVVEIAGPDRFHLDDLLRATLAANGDPREVITADDDGAPDALVPRGPHRTGTVRYPVPGIPTVD